MKVDATKYGWGDPVCFKGEVYRYMWKMGPLYAVIVRKGMPIQAPLRELSLYKGEMKLAVSR